MRWPFCRTLGIFLTGIAAGGCASEPPGPDSAASSLPPGDGRAILERECLSCHELEALALFSDFYDRARWRSLVLTMRDNGAVVADGEVEILAAYLARHYGVGD